MFLFREEYYTYREKPSDSADVGKHAQWQAAMGAAHGCGSWACAGVIGKQRHGPIGSVALSFEARRPRFANAVPDSQQDAQWVDKEHALRAKHWAVSYLALSGRCHSCRPDICTRHLQWRKAPR